jgi:hypothetical protein
MSNIVNAVTADPGDYIGASNTVVGFNTQRSFGTGAKTNSGASTWNFSGYDLAQGVWLITNMLPLQVVDSGDGFGVVEVNLAYKNGSVYSTLDAYPFYFTANDNSNNTQISVLTPAQTYTHYTDGVSQTEIGFSVTATTVKGGQWQVNSGGTSASGMQFTKIA